MMHSGFRFLVLAGVMLCLHAGAQAATCTSQSSGNWNVAGRWSCNRIPGTGDSVVIGAAHTVTLNVNSTIQQIAVNGTLVTDNGNRMLTLTTNSPLFAMGAGGTFTAGDSTVVMNANANVTLTSGAVTFNNLQLTPAINGNLIYTFGSGAIAINGDFDVNPSKGSNPARSLTVNMGAPISVAGTTNIRASGGSASVGFNTVSAANSLTSGRLIVGANATMTANGSTITLNGSSGPLFTLSTLSAFIAGTSTVVMSAPASVDLTSGEITFNKLTVNMPGQTGNMGGIVNVGDTLTLTAGDFAVGANVLNLNGQPIAGNANNLKTTPASSIAFSGSATSVFLPASAAQLNALTVNNANGVTLNASLTLGGLLTLTSGGLDTGGNTLAATGNACPNSISRTSGYVAGNLQLRFSAGIANCTFPVGSGGAYAPITVSKSAATGGGNLTGSTTGSEHPQIAASTIDATRDANRYWTLSGDTINAGSYGVTLGFAAGDVDAGAAATSFVLGKYDGSAWTAPTPVDAKAASTGSTNVAGPLANASFAVGETVFVCSTPPGMPSTMTCVCDNFGRATLNPSTIYGGNWSVSSSSGTFGPPRIVNSGYLQMTDNSGNVATAATMPGTFPAAGNLITVDFKHYAYNGNGADGVALTLSDASITPIPGAYGGSLGYAQKDNANCAAPPCNGFVGGWVGIGIDEFGNFSNPTEGRSGGPGSRPEAVAVRGSGAGLAGYPYLGGTATLSPGIDNPGATSPALGHAYRIMVDARCYQRDTNDADISCSNPALAKRTQVSVYRDTTGAGNFSAANRIIDFDAYAANPSQAAVPANWKLSFTGSTGGNTNIHEIQGLRICAQTITPPAGYRIQVDNLTPSTCGAPGGSPPSPIVTVTALDTNGNIVTTYNKTVTLSATLPGGGASSATWRKVGAAGNLPGNQYTFVPADNGTAQFYLTDASPQTVYLTVTESGGTLASSLATPVQYSGASFNITNIDPLGSSVVAGRSHLMQITRTNGCTADASYTGTKNLDGWYTPASGDHPAGANAPLICATNAGNTCLPTTGACQTLSIAPPVIDASSNFMPALTFAAGSAKFCVATTDVGKYSISLRDDSAAPVAGSSGTLTVRPFAVAVTGVKQGATGNPGSNVETGVVFAKAGANFEATVGGYLWKSTGAGSAGMGDANGDGLPDVTDPGLTQAQVTSGGIAPRYADTVELKAASTFWPTPAPGEEGALTGNSVIVSGGSTTQLSLAYPEVGAFTMTAKPSTNYLQSGIDLADRMVIFANPSVPTRTSIVGRFIPSHFVVAGATIANRSDLACGAASPFTYMGEPMRVRFTIEARNLNDEKTRSYTGNWARLDTTDWIPYGANNSVGLWMIATGYPVAPGTCKAVFGNGPAGANPTSFACAGGATPPAAKLRTAGPRIGTAGTPAAPSWSKGTGTFSADAVLERADMPDGPYAALEIGIAPRDMDGVALKAFNLDADNNGSNERCSLGTTAVRFGRLKLSNALGSEKLNLPIPLRAEYWNGASFITNSDDNCTSIAAGNIALSNYIGGITPANMPGTNASVGGAFVNGIGRLTLNKPTSAPSSKGSVNLCIDLGPDTTAPPACTTSSPAAMPWLQGMWSTQPYFDDDPAMRATFGVYRGGPVIYVREMY